MSRLKVLHCIRSLDPSGGGPADFIRMVAQSQSSLQLEVSVATLDAPDDEWISSFPCAVHALGPARDTFGFSPRYQKWLREHLKNYDLAVINGVWTFISAAARQAAISCGRPYVLFTHGMLDPWFARYRLKHLKKSLYWKLVENKVVRDAEVVLYTSELERVGAQSAFSPYAAQEVVIPYGTMDPCNQLEESRRKFLSLYPRLKDRRYILFLGRLHEKKGVDLLIRAFDQACCNQAEEVPLVLVGPTATSFEQKLNQALGALSAAGRRQVVRIDMIRGEEKWGALACADALILPSHQENFARVVSEALSCSTPVLITNKVNIWGAIECSTAGLVENDDHQGVVNLIQKWHSLDSETRQKIRSNARLCYEQNFDASKNLLAYRSLLSSVAQKYHANRTVST